VHDLDAYLTLALLVGAVWFVARLLMRASIVRALPQAAFAGYVAAVLYAVLFSYSFHGYYRDIWDSVNLVPFGTIYELARPEHLTQAIRQLAGNVVMFVPFGLLLPMASPRFRTLPRLAFAGMLASAGIELLQLILGLTGLIARSVDIDDVILNTLGAAVGFMAWYGARAVWRLRTSEAAAVGDAAD
jgi:glycopeptide antibiotics resistance protein